MNRPSLQDYASYLPEDFLKDPYFQQWVQQGDAAAEDFWNEFIQRFPYKKEAVEQAYLTLMGVSYQPYQLSEEKQNEILRQVYSKRHSRQPLGLSRRMLPWAVAASLSLLVAAAILFLWLPSDVQTFQTAALENKTILLPDGSKVKLNANTILKVAIDLDNDQPREVWLDGEAFFEVKKLDTATYREQPSSRNFIVHTSNFDIKVLGTSFNVYSTEQKSEIMLKTGKVEVESQKIRQSEVLVPGDRLSLAEQENNFSIRKKAPETKLAWRENLFVFENTPLEEVAQAMEQYYGLEVTFNNDELADKLFTAKLSRDEMPTLLKAIEESFRVKVVTKDDKIIITKTL